MAGPFQAGRGGDDSPHEIGDVLEELMKLSGEAKRDKGEDVTMRDILAFSLHKDPAAEGKFKVFVRMIVDGPAMNVIGDVLQIGGLVLVREKEEEHGDEEVTTPERLMEFIAQLFGFASPLGQNQRDPLVGFKTMRDEQSRNEPLTRSIFGDMTGAMRVMNAAMLRGAPSSTESTAWQQQAARHIELFELATVMARKPDYKKGLAHMKEWWNLHRGIDLPRLDLCWGFVKFTICYHELGQLAEAARAVLKFIRVGQTLCPDDCILGRVEEAQVALYLRVASFEKLYCFLDPRVIVSTSPALAALSLPERVGMHGIMTDAKPIVEQERDLQVKLREEKLAREKRKRELEELKKRFEEMKRDVDKRMAEGNRL